MRLLQPTIFICVCALFLSGCQTLNSAFSDTLDFMASPFADEEQVASRTSAQPIGARRERTAIADSPVMPAYDQRDREVYQPSPRLAQAPGVRPVPSFPPPSDNDLMTMTNSMSQGAVEIFPMEQPQQYVPSNYTNYTAPLTTGTPSPTDPNVVIFPLDGGFQNPQAVMSQPLHDNERSMQQAQSFSGLGRTQVFFGHGSSSLDGQDRSILRNAADEARFAPVSRVRVEGHASARAQTGDPVRNSILNLKESMNRAYEVSKTLIQEGVPAEKLQTTAWGDTNTNAANESSARRVDIITGSGY